MLADITVVALAGTFLWVLASQLTTPVIAPIQRWLRRGWRRKLTGCAYCSGFWLSVAGIAGVHAWQGVLDPLLTPVSVLATAGAIGVVGSFFTPGITDDDEH